MIQDVRDTFLHFLADNLSEVRVNILRQEAGESGTFVDNAVNVHFVDIAFADIASQQVVIDVLYDSEDQAVEAVSKLWNLFSAAFYMPLMSYNNPSNPVQLHGNVMLSNKARFMRVNSDNYSHYMCRLSLQFSTL